MKEKTVTEAINYRRSVRVYSDDPLDDAIVKQCLVNASLAPTSSNLQLWEFHHITSEEKCKLVAKTCFNQTAASTAQQLVVVVVRRDLWRQRVAANIEFIKKQFNQKSKILMDIDKNDDRACWELIGFENQENAKLCWQSLCRSIEPNLKEIADWLRTIIKQQSKFKMIDYRRFLAVRMSNEFLGENRTESLSNSPDQKENYNFNLHKKNTTSIGKFVGKINLFFLLINLFCSVFIELYVLSLPTIISSYSGFTFSMF